MMITHHMATRSSATRTLISSHRVVENVLCTGISSSSTSSSSSSLSVEKKTFFPLASRTSRTTSCSCTSNVPARGQFCSWSPSHHSSERHHGHRARLFSTSTPEAVAAVDGRHVENSSPSAEPPDSKTLRQLFFASAVPMVGFGFMDNMVMIQAGDLIDNTIGVKFGLATLTAAACGQVFSDVSGVCFGGVVDAFCLKLGLPVPQLTSAQRTLPLVKRWSTFGAVCGVIVGCTLGMTSLLFMDLEAAERAKKNQELDTIFATVVKEGSEALGAERCSLFVVEDSVLWTRAATGLKGEDIIKVPKEASLVGEAVLRKAVINVPDAYTHPKFNREHDKATGFRTKAVLCVPVFSENDEQEESQGGREVVAVVQLVNSKNGYFSDADLRAAGMLARHVGIFLDQVG
ncbi:unnamed protein product [Amoebophrya sp. A25]|nr:unnamed protein product [Amoebophrya sp. A25]|eukprot:GSA25T00017344001.1